MLSFYPLLFPKERKQGCVAMTTGVFAGLWDVVSCSNKEKYICKKPAEGVHVTTVPPTTPPLSCASGWTPLTNRNFCFKVGGGARLTRMSTILSTQKSHIQIFLLATHFKALHKVRGKKEELVRSP